MAQEELLAAHGTLVSTPFTFKGYVGDEWLMEEPLPPAGMDPDPVAVSQIRNDPAKLQVILDAIQTDSSSVSLDNVCTQSNSYGVGKDIAMVTRLASISRAFETHHYHQLDEKIRRCLEKWLRIDDSLSAANKLEYDPVWGGLFIGSSDRNNFDPHANFGFPMYSDHHFHLGYFLYALGYYVKYHNHWAHHGDNMARIVSVARDVGNPSSLDPHFPVVRHKDWYLGMSWATGIVGGARQAESSTEAINCYHGLAALGEALGDDTMKHVGQLTLATEIRSVRHYWHVRNYNRHIFPEYIKTYGTIGQFAEDAIFYYTLNWPCWPYEFPMRHACLVGIQVIPIISVSNLYMDQEWGRSVQNVCNWAVNPWSAPGAGDVDPAILQPVQKGWGAFCHAAASKADAAAEWGVGKSREVYEWGVGKSRVVYEWGVGKSRVVYEWGMGKSRVVYEWGVGKSRVVYEWGVGKSRSRVVYEWGVGKSRVVYEWGVGKSREVYEWGVGKSREVYEWGVGKSREVYEWGVGKSREVYEWGVGKSREVYEGCGEEQGVLRVGCGEEQGGLRVGCGEEQGGLRVGCGEEQGGLRVGCGEEQGGLRVGCGEEQGGLRVGCGVEQGGLRVGCGEEQGGLRVGCGEEQGGLRVGCGEEQGGLRVGYGEEQGGLRVGCGEEQGGLRVGCGEEQGGLRVGCGVEQGGLRVGCGEEQGGLRVGCGEEQGGLRVGCGEEQGGLRVGCGEEQGGLRVGCGEEQGGLRVG
ncbi:hypothetical protein Bbelb_386660, partial [Branchiostoma belcheri]